MALCLVPTAQVSDVSPGMCATTFPIRPIRHRTPTDMAEMRAPPKMLYGTAWKKDRTAGLVHAALKAGFRGLDTACQPKHYRCVRSLPPRVLLPSSLL